MLTTKSTRYIVEETFKAKHMGSVLDTQCEHESFVTVSLPIEKAKAIAEALNDLEPSIQDGVYFVFNTIHNAVLIIKDGQVYSINGLLLTHGTGVFHAYTLGSRIGDIPKEWKARN